MIRALNILVVDDDQALLRMLTLDLADHGHEIYTASDGKQALDQVDAWEPDVIVLDLELPVMDGRAFYRELRARGRETPVLILSGHNARAAQRELGADAYMSKPFDPEALAATVVELVGSRGEQHV